MGRARGANALVAGVFESTYGTTPGSGFFRLPIVSHGLGAQQPLLASDLLGQGREMLDPTYDVVTNDGDVVVPVDVRNFGYWLKLMFGAPSTSGSATKASQVLTTTGNFADGDTVTIDGKVFTFQSSLTNVDGHVLVGVSAAASIQNLYHAINGAGGTPGTDYAAATVAHPSCLATASTSSTLTVSALIGGPAQDAIAVTEASANASWGAATLAGGACATHVFSSGAATLPSMSLEIGAPEVPAYSTHFGGAANQLKISMARSGLLNATMSLIAQGETALSGASGAGSPTSRLTQRFAQAVGSISRNGAALGSVVSADFTASNNLDKIETIRADGMIDGADPAMFGMTGNIKTRFASTALYDQAVAQDPCALTFGWALGDFSLIFSVPRVFLPRVKRPIEGPAGIMASFDWQSSGALGAACTATLITDVAGF